MYVFGDASGSGFGSSWINPDSHSSDNVLKFRFGVWGEAGKGRSSNYRELRNLIETLEHMGEKGSLKGKEVFVFTDNSVSESIADRGTSSDPLLFDLVVRLLALEMLYGCKIDIIHVSGDRMIAQGSDGLSRGDMYEGVMKGDSFISHIPVGTSALEVHPNL